MLMAFLNRLKLFIINKGYNKMNYSEIYKKLYSNTVEQLKMISDPYNKCEIMTRMMDSLSRLMVADSADTDETTTASTTTKKKSKKESAPVVEETTIEPTVVDTPVAEETATDETVAEDTSTEETTDTDIIDRTSDDDSDVWTEELQEKYADAINHVQEAYNTFGEDEVNSFVDENSNHLYQSFDLDKMPPSVFIAMYTLLKQAEDQ